MTLFHPQMTLSQLFTAWKGFFLQTLLWPGWQKKKGYYNSARKKSIRWVIQVRLNGEYPHERPAEATILNGQFVYFSRIH